MTSLIKKYFGSYKLSHKEIKKQPLIGLLFISMSFLLLLLLLFFVIIKLLYDVVSVASESNTMHEKLRKKSHSVLKMLMYYSISLSNHFVFVFFCYFFLKTLFDIYLFFLKILLYFYDGQ